MPAYDSDRRDRPNGGSGAGYGLEERRERALERLTTAFSRDEIAMEDYEARAALAQRARDEEELARALDGLPGAAPAQGYPAARQESRPARAPYSRPVAQAPVRELRVDPNLSGSTTLACVMGDRQLSGDWLNADRVDSFTLMGSTKIDLRDTAIPEGRLRIEAFCMMGETKVIVPRGLPVKLSAFPFMGEAKVASGVEQRIRPGEPFVDVSGFIMMGSLVVVAMD